MVGLDCSCFDFLPKLFPLEIYPRMWWLTGKKKNRLKFNHSHTQILLFCYLFLIMYQQDVFISRNLIFPWLSYTTQDDGFINPSVMWALLSPELYLIACVPLWAHMIFKYKKIITELITLSEVASYLQLLEQLWTTILVHPQTYLHSCAETCELSPFGQPVIQRYIHPLSYF